MRSFSLLNKLLIAISVLCLVYIFCVFFGSKQGTFVLRQYKDPVPAESPTTDQPYDYYSDLFKKRDIFGIAPSEMSTEEVAKLTSDFTQNLKIVGIIIGSPSEAIIQNEQTMETFFLNPGDAFKGAKVQQISGDKIIFSYNGKLIQMVRSW